MASTLTCPSTTTRTKNIQGRYGFAKLDNDIVLVQLISSPAPRTYRAHVFRHNFVSVFSYSHTQTLLGSNLLEILENDENKKQRCWLEEETATVFAAQDVMTRFIWLKDMAMPKIGVWRPYESVPRRLDRRMRDGAGFRSSLASA